MYYIRKTLNFLTPPLLHPSSYVSTNNFLNPIPHLLTKVIYFALDDIFF